MRRTFSQAMRSATATLAMLAVTLTAGCGQSGPPRAAVSGTVALDKTPIAEGTIAFYPIGDTIGPSTGGEIRDGAFALSESEGPVVGQCRVEIRATKKTGRKTTFGTKVADVVQQYLPEKYNTQSELKAEVTADGPNRFDFSLSSQ